MKLLWTSVNDDENATLLHKNSVVSQVLSDAHVLLCVNLWWNCNSTVLKAKLKLVSVWANMPAVQFSGITSVVEFPCSNFLNWPDWLNVTKCNVERRGDHRWIKVSKKLWMFFSAGSYLPELHHTHNFISILSCLNSTFPPGTIQKKLKTTLHLWWGYKCHNWGSVHVTWRMGPQDGASMTQLLSVLCNRSHKASHFPLLHQAKSFRDGQRGEQTSISVSPPSSQWRLRKRLEAESRLQQTPWKFGTQSENETPLSTSHCKCRHRCTCSFCVLLPFFLTSHHFLLPMVVSAGSTVIPLSAVWFDFWVDICF